MSRQNIKTSTTILASFSLLASTLIADRLTFAQTYVQPEVADTYAGTDTNSCYYEPPTTTPECPKELNGPPPGFGPLGGDGGSGAGGGGKGVPSCTGCTSAGSGLPDGVSVPLPPIVPIDDVPLDLPGFYASGSVIDHGSMRYYHFGWDIIPTASDAVGLMRIHRPRDSSIQGSFGPGVFCQLDDHIILTAPGGGSNMQGQLFGTRELKSYNLTRSQYSADISLVSIGQATQIKNIQLLKADLLPITTLNAATFDGAAFIQVNHWGGDYVRFKLFNVGVAHQRTARVCEYSSIAGKTTIQFKTWTAAELAASPTRAFQIHSVTDRYGKQLTNFNYAWVGNDWVLTGLTDFANNSITYTYGTPGQTPAMSDNKLISVTYPDTTQSTFTYGINTVAACNTIDVVDLAASPGHRRKKIYLNNGSNLGYGNAYSNPLNSLKQIQNGSGEVAYVTVRPNGATNYSYLGAGRMKMVSNVPEDQGSQDTTAFMKTWQVTASGATSSVTGTAEPSASIGTIYGGSANGAVQTTSASGHVVQYDYDSDRFVRGRLYADGTFETFCRNAMKLVTRYRDRNGKVTRTTYNALGQKTLEEVGLTDDPSNASLPYWGGYEVPENYNKCATNDVQTADYATQSWTYVAAGSPGAGLVASYTNQLGKTTNYTYTTDGRLSQVLLPPDVTGGPRSTTTYAYDTAGHLQSITEPSGSVINYSFDVRGRMTQELFQDATRNRWVYGTSGTGLGLLVRTIDRVGSVTTMTYDLSDRLVTRVQAAFTKDGSDNDVETPYGVSVTEQLTYFPGSEIVQTRTINGAKTEYVIDYRGRIIETKNYPRANKTLIAKRQYENNQLYKNEDAYGRCTYYAYDASNGRLVRTVTATVPEWTPPAPGMYQTLSQVLLAITRDSNPNAKYIVNDIVYESNGNVKDQVDGRGTTARILYDSRNRPKQQLAAFGTSLEAKTETLYDAAGNVTEVRSPRYFNSSDSEGYNKARETWTYNGRNLVASHTEAPGTGVAATEYFTYDLNGHKATHTDFGGNVWTMIEAGCCALTRANVDPLGHGSIVNADSRGRPVHQITVSDVTSHSSNYNNPDNSKTITESTTKYDPRGRATHRTTWLSARGLVDTANPPIAGLNNVALADGFTSITLYDDNLTDGQGLDSSTGVSVIKQSGASPSGTFNVSLTNALTKLADTQANGGAGISFNSSQGAVGRAVVSINSEDEVSFSISDATGRTVMSGKLNNYKGSGSTAVNTLATWSTQLHDATASLSGYGTVLESKSIDALGYATRSWTDAAGRTMKSFDQLDKATTITYDAGGNQLTVRDPNNVGADMVYDALGRNTQRTDTVSAVTKTAYDKSGNAIKQTDAKNKDTFITFDARGRRKQTTDRISAVTAFTYTALGQLASLTDAESQTTSYTYSVRGEKLTETYPDHSGGNPGDSTYGIVTFVYDNAGRLLRKQDQLGDTCTFNYDLAGRMTSRNYRTKVNSPSGTIADSDTFTFDRVGHMLTAVSGRYSNTVTYTYDLVGRKATEALTTNSQTYTIGTEFNVRGELVKYTYPDSSIQERTYHATGALNLLKLDGNTVSTRTYDDGTRLTGETLGNGVTEARAYANDNLLTSITYGGTGTAIGNLSYTWDANKNKTSETIGGVMADWGFTSGGTTYDHEDRLTGYARAGTSSPSQLSQSWSLTSVGDWTSTTINGTAHTRTHGPTHELLTNKIGSGSTQNVTHDVKGNMTSIPVNLREAGASTALNLVWDFDNRMKSADINADSTPDVTFTYDALGRRVTRSHSSGSWVFVQSDQQTLCDYVIGQGPSNALYRYVYASYIDEPVVRKETGTSGTILYFHRNQQYSIYAMTNSSGSVVERYAYTAYGQPTFLDVSGSQISNSTISNRYTYTAREWEHTVGLHYFRARWMSGNSGRFTGRDPLGHAGGKETFYSYCDSKAFSRTDPSGLASCKVKLICGTLAWPAEHCGIETSTDDGNTWKRWHVVSPGAGILSFDTCAVEDTPNRIKTPFSGIEWRDEGTWLDPTGQLCECIDQAAANITSRDLPYYPLPENRVYWTGGWPGKSECHTTRACNSNYSTHCMMKRCGITAERPYAPGWDHRMKICSKWETPCWYKNRCRCAEWSEEDGDWCAEKPNPPRIPRSEG